MLTSETKHAVLKSSLAAAEADKQNQHRYNKKDHGTKSQ